MVICSYRSLSASQTGMAAPIHSKQSTLEVSPPSVQLILPRGMNVSVHTVLLITPETERLNSRLFNLFMRALPFFAALNVNSALISLLIFISWNDPARNLNLAII